MKTIGYLIQKEFIQIVRNKAILPMMTILPIFQLIVLSNAASTEVKHVNIALVDRDLSEASRLLDRKINANSRFTIVDAPESTRQAMELMQANKADIILEIPDNFEKDFMRGEHPFLQVLVNATNGQQAIVGNGYLEAVIKSFGQELKPGGKPGSSEIHTAPHILISTQNWYNPELEYTHFMAPGILAELTALLTMVLSAMNTVREREIGTIEQINVTPIKKWEFILGKLIPFLCIGLLLLTVGLIASKLIFDIPVRGNVALIFAYAVVNLIAVLGFGLLISNFANTQQQAIFVAFFFILIFILMCGLFTPIDSMPSWAQYLTIPNPLAHFISVSRKVLMKGSGFGDIQREFLYTLALAVVFNGLAIWSYKKQE